MGHPVNRKMMEERLNPLRDEMTADRFTRLLTDVVAIEESCRQMALFPADGTPIFSAFAIFSESASNPAEPIGRKRESNRYRKIKADITHRLRGACTHCSEVEFFSLVDRMTRIQLRGESQRARLISAIDRGLSPS